MDNLKPERRPWTAREIAMLLAIVAMAVALFLERNARRDGDLDATKSTDVVERMVTDHSATDAEWKIEHGKKLDHLESRVLDLEHEKKAGN